MTPPATVPAVTLSKQRARALARHARQLDAARDARDQEIIAAAAEGATLREIAEAVGLSFAGVKHILDRNR
jgi:DNA-binding NarL/FixJ family response regulator